MQSSSTRVLVVRHPVVVAAIAMCVALASAGCRHKLATLPRDGATDSLGTTADAADAADARDGADAADVPRAPDGADATDVPVPTDAADAADAPREAGLDGAADADAAADALPTCAANEHLCAGLCARNDDTRTCGTSCSPCTPVTGGTVSCDGTQCIVTCPTGKFLCLGACVDNTQSCGGDCPTGSHLCGNLCPSNTSTAACGTACVVCPAPASHGAAACVTGACAISCDTGYKNCPGTSLCVPTAGCCVAADCASGPANTTGVCGAANTCSYPCATGFKTCAGSTACISGCCVDADCASTPAAPACNTTTHACQGRPNGAACTTQAECSSGSCLTCYVDADGDTFGNRWMAPLGNFCGLNGVCPLGSVSNNGDCHDGNAAVNPNATFHTTQYTMAVGDPSFDGWDWNCDDQETMQSPTLSNWNLGCQIGSDCTSFSNCLTNGPVTTAGPPCGQSISNVPCDANSCLNGSICRNAPPTETFTQGCR